MSDSGYIRLVKNQIADKKAQLDRFEERLNNQNSSDNKR